ncbi:MAG: hypothetical protein IPN14_00295 [Bacteroidetes bacterium]|nr:hypothetical protein [Bacteroidota bacterium]
MITIFIEIGEQELEVTFNKSHSPVGDIWMTDEISDAEVIYIKEIDGMLDERSLSISPGFRPHHSLSMNDYLPPFNDFREEVNAGFEPTKENVVDSTLPQPYNPDQ